MDRLGYVIVPRNREGMVGQMAGNADADDLVFFPFTRADNAAIAPLLNAFQHSFGFDAAGRIAEQLIDTRYAGFAEDLARDYAANADSPAVRDACLRVADALATAQEYGSYAEFDLIP